jgi:hypothetical protein
MLSVAMDLEREEVQAATAPQLPVSRFVPLGRLAELTTRPDADLLAYSVQGCDAKVTRYKSRVALLAFCRDGSSHHALIKTPVHPNMLVNRNTQRPTK